MKNLLIHFSSALLLLASCDDREQWIEDLNAAPQLTLTGESENDTLSTRLKYIAECDNCKEIRYNAQDPDGSINSITYQLIKGDGEVRQNDQAVDKLGTNQTVFYYKPLKYGEHLLEITATDNFGLSDISYLLIDVFENEQPIATLSIEQDKDGIYTEFILDASGSVDGDAEYGGFIRGYHYEIENPNGSTKIIDTPLAIITESFPGQGTYNVYLNVIDSDGAYSESIRKVVNVN